MSFFAAITTQRRPALGAGLLLAVWPACGGGQPEPSTAAPTRPAASTRAPTAQDQAPACPATAPAPALLPGTEPEHLRADYWLERVGATRDLDEVLLAPDDIRRLDASMHVPRERFFPQRDLLEPFDAADMHTKLAERMTWLRDKIAAGDYVTSAGAPPTTAALAATVPGLHPELRVTLGQVPFYCAPTTEGLFTSPDDLRIDRNRCSTARAQEVVQVLAAWPGGMQLARTRYTWGWIPGDAALSPPLSAAHAERFVRGPFATVARPGPGDEDVDERAAQVPDTGPLPLAGTSGRAVLLATAGGVIETRVPADWLRPAPRPLTRRAVIEEAFRYVGMPYGFGGKDGGRDCSRLMLDIFETFGIRLPRHSSWQSRAGSYSIDVSGVDEAERLLIIDAAAARGVVLLHLPGHIMLYLGRNHQDRAMALHAFAEYKAPCPEAGETLFHVDRVQVTDLELGRGTSKTALIERIDRIAVLGKPPGVELAGAAELRPAAPMAAPTRRACRRAGGGRIFFSPARPDSSRPLRVVATAAEDPGAATLALVDPTGAVHRPPVVRLGGPPHGFVTTIAAPARGRWMAVLGDGDDIRGCERVYVRSRPRAPDRGEEQAVGPAAGAVADPVWPLQRAWTPAMEDLHAIFVERLFDYPIDEDLTWSGLHELLRDAGRNILHDHLGLGEDEHLVMAPDCADLPYTLRAYFAWKLGLPFGFHDCPRARPGKPPRCEREGDNLMSRSELDAQSLSERDDQELHADVRAFARFIDREVRREVHSSSGRTHPGADATDFYPVPLTREALRPGTLFTDPYGHLLVIADWIPQGAGRYGVLVGADAQPDGTVGRRRFWRGSFLFDPDTTSGGAGFKAFRPWVLDEASGQLVALENRELRGRRRVAPYSTDQYEGSADDFYEAMDALVNPRPLDPRAMLVALVDALEETVSRRVTSVQNGEDYMRSRGFATIDMPAGASIFLTTGPWEDYATPSRDLRLLISIDAVVGFPDMVARAPVRFGVRGDRADVDAAVDALRARLEQELGSRTLRYTRSDGSEQAFTLAELVRRQERLEVAYNPNDCVEIRWAAAPDTAEMKTCARRAPAEQRARMERHRGWFQTRSRPAN